MRRFICNTWPEYKVAGPVRDGRQEMLQFHRGSLDTDDAGAAVIRGLPEFGGAIIEGDPTAPAHGDAEAALAKINADAAVEVAERAATRDVFDTRYCIDCDKTFITTAQFLQHRMRHHNATRVNEEVIRHG